jgi:hypothetical protein
MSDLVQQIRDAIAERRGLAEDAVDPLADEWFEADGLCDRGMTPPDAAFIEAHSPAAVLALCKAAESILTEHNATAWPATTIDGVLYPHPYICDCCSLFMPCGTVVSVAAMFGVDASVSPTSKTDQRTEQ